MDMDVQLYKNTATERECHTYIWQSELHRGVQLCLIPEVRRGD